MSSVDTEFCELTTTVETLEQAQQLARVMIDRRLAACVQIAGPLVSIYQWQGRVAEAEEFRCTAKTTRQHIARLMALVQKHHPYEVPELLVLPILQASQAYGAWLKQEVL